MPRPQLHKTTPVRVVGDFVPLNKYLVSKLNLGKIDPISCPTTLILLRAKSTSLKGNLFSVDMSKAFLRIYVDDDQQKYLGICLLIPFGVTTAPRILEVTINKVLQKTGLQAHVIFYVDDCYTSKGFIQSLRDALKHNGIPTKEPEPVSDSRVLGLTNNNGKFKKRGQVPKLECDKKNPEKLTRRSVHSLSGVLVSHYPIAGWLRPATLQLNRLVTALPSYDTELDETIIKKCTALQKLIETRGDPVQGFDPEKLWFVKANLGISTISVTSTRLNYSKSLEHNHLLSSR
jgi:hypothetical protein